MCAELCKNLILKKGEKENQGTERTDDNTKKNAHYPKKHKNKTDRSPSQTSPPITLVPSHKPGVGRVRGEAFLALAVKLSL